MEEASPLAQDLPSDPALLAPVASMSPFGKASGKLIFSTDPKMPNLIFYPDSDTDDSHPEDTVEVNMVEEEQDEEAQQEQELPAVALSPVLQLKMLRTPRPLTPKQRAEYHRYSDKTDNDDIRKEERETDNFEEVQKWHFDPYQYEYFSDDNSEMLEDGEKAANSKVPTTPKPVATPKANTKSIMQHRKEQQKKTTSSVVRRSQRNTKKEETETYMITTRRAVFPENMKGENMKGRVTRSSAGSKMA